MIMLKSGCCFTKQSYVLSSLFIVFLVGIFFLAPRNSASAAYTECYERFKGECKTFCGNSENPLNAWGLGQKKFISQGDYGCGWTERCCVRGDIYCREESGGKASCHALSECPPNIGRDPGWDQACRSVNTNAPVCCETGPQESQCTYSGYNGGRCQESCDPASEKSTGSQYDEICRQIGKGSFCCEKNITSLNDKLKDCLNQGGECKSYCDTQAGKQILDDKDACKNVDTSTPFCCKSSNAPGVGTTAPSGPGGTPGPTSEHGYSFVNPIGFSSFTQMIVKVLTVVQQIIGWLAVIFILVGAVMYIVSGGSGLTNTAKATITWALVGFAIAVAGPSIIREIYEVFSSGASSGANLIDQANPIKRVITNVLTFLLTAVGVLAIIGFVVSGILYVTSAGRSDQAGTASKAMQYTLMGIIVSGAGLILIKQILTLAAGR